MGAGERARLIDVRRIALPGLADGRIGITRLDDAGVIRRIVARRRVRAAVLRHGGAGAVGRLGDIGERPVLDALIGALHGRDLLLVLDNLEHVLDDARSEERPVGEEGFSSFRSWWAAYH